ncbi:unnamed protein product [Mytilus coruscus]|uniref:Uncharacterized protein n=1 Tax=Mytilus coruscus TaxID=42192 RepID=A0A6J7ZYA2_MYTCO|nr:unnamed protein product [Mytilus coruscus]
MSSSDSDSEPNNTLNTEAREFSAFSLVEDVANTENNKADAAKNVTSVNKKSDKPGLSKGPGKGPGKNKKGKAPMKRKNVDGGEVSQAKKSKLTKSDVEYRNLYNLMEDFFYSYVQNKAGSSTPHNEQTDIDIQNMVDNEDPALDLEDVNIFQAEALDENNNAAVNSNDTDEFISKSQKSLRTM